MKVEQKKSYSIEHITKTSDKCINIPKLSEPLRKCKYSILENKFQHKQKEYIDLLDAVLLDSEIQTQRDGLEINLDDDAISKLESIEDELAPRFIKKAEAIRKERLKQYEKKFCLDKETLPQQINHALGFVEVNNKKLRYYGTKIFENVEEKNKKGELFLKKVKNPVLITEDKKIMSQQSADFEFNFISEMGIQQDRWDLDHLKEFLRGDFDEITFKEVFADFKAHFTRSMVYESEIWYDFLAIWCITTYFQDLCNKSLIVKVEGASGVAKSKTGGLVCNLAFNGKKFLCPTPANFFRYRHNNKSTLFIEEAERLFADKTKNQGDSELIEYLNGSYEKGNTVPRQNDKNLNQTEEFDPYGWTMIGSIKPLKGALEKRSITLYQIKAKKGDKRASVEISPLDKEFILSRAKAYSLGLLKHKEFQEELNKIKQISGLNNREWLVSKPILAMANCINPELCEKIGSFLTSRFNIRDDSLSQESWDYRIIYHILKETASNKAGVFLSNQELTDYLKNYNEMGRITQKTINSLMKKLGFDDFRKRDSTGTKRGYDLIFWKVADITLRNGYLSNKEILKLLSDLSFMSEDKISTRDFEEWYADKYSDKQSDKQTPNQKSSFFSDESDRQTEYIEGGDKVNSIKITFDLMVNSGEEITEDLLNQFQNKEIMHEIKQKYLAEGKIREVKPNIYRRADK